MKVKEWDLVIKPKNNWFDLQIMDLWQYRDLIFMFVKRDFVTLYKQTILGPLWYIIQPVFTTLVFTVIFGKVAKIPTDNIPPFLFYMSGNVAWTYFATCFGRTSDTFNTNTNIFGKVYFPRLSIPISVVVSSLVQFGIQFILFLVFCLYFFVNGAPLSLSVKVFVLPILIVQMALLGFGFGVLVSSLTTKYKDLRFAVGFVVQLWMYATPIVYPLSLVPEWLLPYYIMNPMVMVVENFRGAFLGGGTFNLYYSAISWVVTLFFLVAGVVLFSRVEKTFMDSV